jgi:hypothetical protein
LVAGSEFFWKAYRAGTSSAVRSSTGPINPDSSNGASFVQW